MGPASTNSIESVWAVLKRGLHGVYHHASKKHLARYVDEFTFRLNEGNVARHTLQRLDSFVDAIRGKRLTYKQLTAEGASVKDVPEVLDRVADKVLNYRPKPKSKAGKRRARRKRNRDKKPNQG